MKALMAFDIVMGVLGLTQGIVASNAALFVIGAVNLYLGIYLYFKLKEDEGNVPKP